MDDGKIDDAERVVAGENFLKSAPLCEFPEVHKEVKFLLGNDELLKQSMKNVPKEWESRLAPVATGKDPPYVLVCPEGKLGAGEYACPRSGNAYTVDWPTQKAKSDRNLTDAEKSQLSLDDPLRQQLENQLKEFVSNHHDEVGKFAVFKNGSKYILCIHADKSQKRSFWTGNFSTRAVLDSDTGNMEFSTRVQTHYWEDGNVQMNSNHNTAAQVKKGAAMAVDAIVALKKHENSYHTTVSKDFQFMHDNTLKLMRRTLPVTKSKMDWDKLANYNLAKGGDK